MGRTPTKTQEEKKPRGRPRKYALNPLPPSSNLCPVLEEEGETFLDSGFDLANSVLIDDGLNSALMGDAQPDMIFELPDLGFCGHMPVLEAESVAEPFVPPPADGIAEMEPSLIPKTPDFVYPEFSQEDSDPQSKLLPPSEPPSPVRPDPHAEAEIQEAERQWRLELEASQRAVEEAAVTEQNDLLEIKHASESAPVNEALELLVEVAVATAPMAEAPEAPAVEIVAPLVVVPAVEVVDKPTEASPVVIKRTASPLPIPAKRQKIETTDEGEWIQKKPKTNISISEKIAALSIALKLEMDKQHKAKKEKKRADKEKQKKRELKRQEADLAALAKQVAAIQARLAGVAKAQ